MKYGFELYEKDFVKPYNSEKYLIEEPVPGFIEHVFKTHPQFKPKIIPLGLRHFTNNYAVFVRPPQLQRVNISPHSKSQSSEITQTTYVLPLPWQVVFIIFSQHPDDKSYNIGNIMTFWTEKEFSADKESYTDLKFYVPPYLNLHGDGSICLPSINSIDDLSIANYSLSDIYTYALYLMWDSGWNTDITSSCFSYISAIKNSASTDFFSQNIPSKTKKRIFDSAEILSITEFFKAWSKISLDSIIYSKTPLSNSIFPHYKNFDQVLENCKSCFFRSKIPNFSSNHYLTALSSVTF